ncbi:DUF423 domain-containing protein [Actomonas aquatica]|uniref:DUF423 domain-containing protein n=1 Tax=Actomonas aquatica TaxID=2866162 RepID=A0ABZ1CEB1_9BACT|nr:DUF423 domain-containing protein [Opitutus sp. WL0086]WRQ89776.1 DUF423 domain-containing protein [Opitutus sp. WL0086]
MKNITLIAAVFGFLGVALGAFGAHALKDTLATANMTDVWQTAVLYHLLHAIAAWVAASRLGPEGAAIAPKAGWCWLLGIVFFSGSLYAMALGGPRWLGPITPLGGVFFLVGWVFAGVSALRRA